MTKKEKSIIRVLSDKLYGGINMSWITVILYAVATAVLTVIFLLVPVFSYTSFERMGVTLESWIFFAIIIMANCKKPIESAIKTFVFFLISQPLIYIFQVPFSSLGWGIVSYYVNWIPWTIATFPMAYVGWYITKKNWLSLLILSPMLYILTSDYVHGFQFTFNHFPHLLVMAVFCLGQVLMYLYTFTDNSLQKVLGFILPLIAVIIVLLVIPPLGINASQFLPDDPVLSENAVVEIEDSKNITITIEATGENSMIRIQAADFVDTGFVIRDNDRIYRYTIKITEDDRGYTQIEITPQQ